jgi:hypothetical protein
MSIENRVVKIPRTHRRLCLDAIILGTNTCSASQAASWPIRSACNLHANCSLYWSLFCWAALDLERAGVFVAVKKATGQGLRRARVSARAPTCARAGSAPTQAKKTTPRRGRLELVSFQPAESSTLPLQCCFCHVEYASPFASLPGVATHAKYL